METRINLAAPFRPRLRVELPLPERGLCGNGTLAGRERSQAVALARRAAMYAAMAARYEQYPHHLSWVYDGTATWFPLASVRVGVKVLAVHDPFWSRWLGDDRPPLDDDNFWRGCKPYLDGFQDARVVVNDGLFFLDGKIGWRKGTPYAGGLTFILTPEVSGDDTAGEPDAGEPAASERGLAAGQDEGA